jgi:hypothetical protein
MGTRCVTAGNSIFLNLFVFLVCVQVVIHHNTGFIMHIDNITVYQYIVPHISLQIQSTDSKY